MAAKKRRDKQQAGTQGAAPADPPSTADPAAGGLSTESMERLRELSELHEQGVLTDDEFAREKAKVLGS